MKMVKFPGNQLAENLIAQMKSREEILFNNQVLNAAVFLDPRYQKFMPNENKENAIHYLQRLYVKIESMNKMTRSNDTVEQPNTESDELAAFLCSIYGDSDNNNTDTERSDENQTPIICEENICEKLKKFIGSTLPIDACIFDYWENNKQAQPELYKLASVIHAVPPTQTTVERAFSAMALILSPLRTNLCDTVLENILTLRLNREIFEEICAL